MIYVSLDNDSFVNGWSDMEFDNSVKVEKEKVSNEIKLNFMQYRYDVETEEFILDPSKLFNLERAQLLVRFNQELINKNIEGFKVTINGELLRFQNTDSNRSFLQKAYSMMESGLISSTTMKFINENGNEVPKVVSGSNIYEVWILSFMHEDELNKHFNEVIMPQIENSETLEDLSKITWEGSQV